MSFNLLTEPWLPVRTVSGGRRRIRPAEIAADIEGDYPVAPDWARPDLSVASYELLIGLLSLAAPPGDRAAWIEGWRAPPAPEALDAAFAPFRPAFALDGEGPRFLQEFGGLDGETTPVEALLIDAAGANAAKKNADLLTHRGRLTALSPGAAAIALHALQAFAPSGGAGNRTSMRGGGPMTTLVLPEAEADGRPASLWRRIWAHVDHGRPPPPEDWPRVLPWLAPTLTSEKGGAGQVHSPEAGDPRAHKLQAFFGMPRRIRLVFAPGPATCGLNGEPCEVAVMGFVQKPWGIDYGLWTHPLTPYRQEKEGAEPYTAKPKPGRMAPGDWAAAVVARDSALRRPAAAVTRARSDRRDFIGRGARLLAAGWAMNNMEAQVFLHAETPLHVATDPEVAEAVDKAALQAAEAADLAQAALRGALKEALKEALKAREAPADKGLFAAARAEFFDALDPRFHAFLANLAAAEDQEELPARADPARDVYGAALARAALAVFDRRAPIPVHDPLRAKPIASARNHLRMTLRGWGKSGHALFDALGVPRPQKQEEPA